MKLAGRNTLITGGSRGLGAAIAQVLGEGFAAADGGDVFFECGTEGRGGGEHP